MTAIEYTIFEQLQPPQLEKPITDNPMLDNPVSDNPMQLNKELLAYRRTSSLQELKKFMEGKADE